MMLIGAYHDICFLCQSTEICRHYFQLCYINVSLVETFYLSTIPLNDRDVAPTGLGRFGVTQFYTDVAPTGLRLLEIDEELFL